MFGGIEMGHEFHHAVGQWQHPGVVGGHHHHPVTRGQFADEREHFLDLDVVQMGGRLVGDQ